MSKSVRAAVELASEAETDLRQITDFLYELSSAVAWRFVDDYELTIGLLRDFPLIGPARDGYRRLLIGRSGYRLIYVVDPGLVRIVRIEHAKDPHAI